MTRGLSLYLDVVRFAAAVVVLITHLAYRELSGGQLAGWRAVGNDAVTVFFVLSGLVIAHVVREKDHTARDYAVARLARLWSVAIPALAMTVLLDRWGAALNPAAYAAWWMQDSNPLYRLFAAATFTNQLWFLSVRPFSNGPFWSLGYEAWYYVIFGCWTFTSGLRRLALTGAVLLFVGPKILLMLPAWLLGVVVYKSCRARTFSPLPGVALFIAPVVAYAAFRLTGGPEFLLGSTTEVLGAGRVSKFLGFSNEFLSSGIIGILVALHFAGAYAISDHLERLLGTLKQPIRLLAGCTFATYLVHYPVLRFFGAVLPYDRKSALEVGGVFVLTMLVCVGVGLITERHKTTVARWLNSAADLWTLRLKPRLARESTS